jgi:pimeloyl-ACP methyl ester carboxylesterase
MSETATMISSILDEQGISEAKACLTPSSDKTRKVVECDPRPIVPVVFLPGVMGTNLKASDGKPAWTPPNVGGPMEVANAIVTLVKWSTMGAADRQKRLNPKNLSVDNSGPVNVGESGLTKEQAQARGWSEVHKDSYHGILAYLQVQLNHPMLRGKPEGDWIKPQEDEKDLNKKLLPTPVLQTSPKRYGAQGSGPSMDDGMLKTLATHQYPVHAVGYNWAQSNGKSAAEVFTRIQAICKKYGTDKAIVITHSMGGIVARGMIALIPESKNWIYGIVHGAQPATGAPVAAKRFRTGAEDFVGKIMFGANDAEWAAVSASSPAALELMPMPDYLNGKPWWLIQDEAGNNVLELPKASAAMELYASTEWYALIPDANEALIDPTGIIKQNGGTSSAREIYKSAVREAKEFQKKILGQYHPFTFALFGDGVLTDSSVVTKSQKALKTFGSVRWRGPLPPGTSESDLLAATLVGDNHHGELQIRVRGQIVTLKLQDADQAGDGTVPAASAAAQVGARGVQQAFQQGGYEHQFCYDHPWARWATLYSVAQIAQSISSS